ncbi:MAG: hypothetical protein ACO3PV_08785, partial [Pseudohongiellaceae bacterium]
MKTIPALLLLTTFATPLSAQWLEVPTPGIPRTIDGAADMTAAVPRTLDGKPQFDGLWRIVNEGGGLRDASNIQAWALESMAAHER